MACGHSRKDIPCKLLGIFTLFYINHNFTNQEKSILVQQARYSTSVVVKYLDIATVKTSKMFTTPLFHII